MTRGYRPSVPSHLRKRKLTEGKEGQWSANLDGVLNSREIFSQVCVKFFRVQVTTTQEPLILKRYPRCLFGITALALLLFVVGPPVVALWLFEIARFIDTLVGNTRFPVLYVGSTALIIRSQIRMPLAIRKRTSSYGTWETRGGLKFQRGLFASSRERREHSSYSGTPITSSRGCLMRA